MYDQVALVQNQIGYVCPDTMLVRRITAQFRGYLHVRLSRASPKWVTGVTGQD